MARVWHRFNAALHVVVVIVLGVLEGDKLMERSNDDYGNILVLRK